MKSITLYLTFVFPFITCSLLQAQYFSEKLPKESSEEIQLIFNDTIIQYGNGNTINIKLEGGEDVFYSVSQSDRGLRINIYNLTGSVEIGIEPGSPLTEPMLSLGGIHFLQSTDSINLGFKTNFKGVNGEVILPVLWKLNKAYPGIELDDSSVNLFHSTDSELIYSTSESRIEEIGFTLDNNLDAPIDAVSIDLMSLLSLKNTKYRDKSQETFSACAPNNLVLLLDNSSSVDTIQKKAIVEGIYRLLDSLSVINNENNNTFTILTSNSADDAEEIISIEGNISEIQQNSMLEKRLDAWSVDTVSYSTNLTTLVKTAKNYLHPHNENLVLQVFNGYSNGDNGKRKPGFHEMNNYLEQIELLRKMECKFILLSFKEMNENEARSMSTLIHGDNVYTSNIPTEFQEITYLHRENPIELFLIFSSVVIASCEEAQQRSVENLDKTFITTTEQAAKIRLIYPNPGRDIISVYVSHFNSDKAYNLEVVDIFGKTVWQGVMTQEQRMIDISGYPAGIYFLILKHRYEYADVQKLIKQ